MSDDKPLPPQPNTLGKTSLFLGVLSSAFVFSIGLCAGLGKEQGWLKHVEKLLFVIGASFAFLGFLAAVLGFGGLFGRNRSRATAVMGFILGAGAVLLFVAIVNSVR